MLNKTLTVKQIHEICYLNRLTRSHDTKPTRRKLKKLADNGEIKVIIIGSKGDNWSVDTYSFLTWLKKQKSEAIVILDHLLD